MRRARVGYCLRLIAYVGATHCLHERDCSYMQRPQFVIGTHFEAITQCVLSGKACFPAAINII